jgi:periplasmic divalent cation tolerance protein
MVLIMTTVSTDSEADALAGGLLAGRLAACIQSLPITSRYRWEGGLQHAAEILLMVKTPEDRAEAVRAHIGAAHPYEVPEIVTIRAEASAPYLAWMEGETASP